MKKKVSYSYKLKFRKDNADILNTHCECPAGKGPHGTCKHLAAVLIMLTEFVAGSNSNVEKSCTEILQTFHKPKKSQVGTPVKAENLYKKAGNADLTDPRPVSFRNRVGYSDHVRNTVINFCSSTSKDLAVRYIFDKADIQTAAKDHDFFEKPFNEYWVDRALVVNRKQAEKIEKLTRKQASSLQWHEQRLWRITASRFGEVCKVTARRHMDKLCKSFISTSTLCSKPLIHGRQYEPIAIRKFEQKTGLTVKSCGLHVDVELPYLACSPDGIIRENDEAIVEVKCPYSGRDCEIKPGKYFPFLEYDNDENISLKQTSNYYYQVQGQLYICRKSVCYFVVYTFKDLLILEVEKDIEYCKGSLIPKLTCFYDTFLKKYTTTKM